MNLINRVQCASLPLLFIATSAIALSPKPIFAQIVPDATLPHNSHITREGHTHFITHGTEAGTNLFHSFEEFSLPIGETAFFDHAANIQNIITRVTGSNISHIDGVISASGNAHLFLINPNGITFGENASLNLGGSFLATTGESLQFADGTTFSATSPLQPLLTVSLPIGVQFGATPGQILHRSRANNTGLQVPFGQTLAILGGEVRLEGGTILASEGQVVLGGLAESGVVSLHKNNVSFPDDVARANVALTQNAEINVLGGQGGNITIYAQDFYLTQGSTLRAGISKGFGQGGQAGNIDIHSTGAIQLTDAGSLLSNAVLEDSFGMGGDINISAASVSITNGAALQASTWGQGDAGSININAVGNVLTEGVGTNLFSSGIYNRVEQGAVGKGKGININAAFLNVTQGAVITASTNGQGNAGNVQVNVGDTVNLDGASPFNERLGFGQSSGLFSSVKANGVGQGGTIDITTESLFVTNGAVVIASTFNQGAGGTIQVHADRVYLGGVGINGQTSGLLTPTEPNARGKGGEIDVHTNLLQIFGGGVISSPTRNASPGGSIRINANTFEAINGGQVITTTSSDGKAGDIFLNVANTTRILGRDDAFSQRPNAAPGDVVSGEGAVSGLFASTSKDSTGEGAGGSITVQTGQLIVSDGAAVTVSSQGEGAAGNVSIFSNSILLESGNLQATTVVGDRGNIFLQSHTLQLRQESQITTNAFETATGGNINIDTNTLVALENSDITANSVNNFGGEVTIDALAIFGTTFQQYLTPKSDITATSERGVEFSGIVNINIPSFDPTQSLVAFPENFANIAGLMYSSCSSPDSLRSSFRIRGRSGKPPSPHDSLSSYSGWFNSPTSVSIPVSSQDYSSPVVEAKGMMINSSGNIVLTTDSMTVPSHPSGFHPPSCNEV